MTNKLKNWVAKEFNPKHQDKVYRDIEANLIAYEHGKEVKPFYLSVFKKLEL